MKQFKILLLFVNIPVFIGINAAINNKDEIKQPVVSSTHYVPMSEIAESVSKSDDLNESLFYAITENRIDDVENLLDRNAEFDAITENKIDAEILGRNASDFVFYVKKGHMTPLIYCIMKNRYAIADLLIKKGANINAQDILGWTSLITAIRRKSPEMVMLLLKAGADVTIPNRVGTSFLEIIKEPDYREFQDLYDNFVLSQEHVKEAGRRLFDLIEQKRAQEIIDLLKINPEAINVKSEIAESALNLLILYEQFDLIKVIFEDPDIKIKPKLGLLSNDDALTYAYNLGKPYEDPKKKIYRDIALYLIKLANKK